MQQKPSVDPSHQLFSRRTTFHRAFKVGEWVLLRAAKGVITSSLVHTVAAVFSAVVASQPSADCLVLHPTLHVSTGAGAGHAVRVAGAARCWKQAQEPVARQGKPAGWDRGSNRRCSQPREWRGAAGRLALCRHQRQHGLGHVPHGMPSKYLPIPMRPKCINHQALATSSHTLALAFFKSKGFLTAVYVCRCIKRGWRSSMCRHHLQRRTGRCRCSTCKAVPAVLQAIN